MVTAPRNDKNRELASSQVTAGDHQVGFAIIARRYMVKRLFTWINRNRRLSKDVEPLIKSVKVFLYAAFTVIVSPPPPSGAAWSWPGWPSLVAGWSVVLANEGSYEARRGALPDRVEVRVRSERRLGAYSDASQPAIPMHSSR